MKKYRILIDTLHIRSSLHTGIGSVARDIIKGFAKYSDWDIVVMTWDYLDSTFDETAGKHLDYLLVPQEQQKYLDKKLNIKRCPDFLIKQIEDKRIDLVFTTCYTINSYIYPKRFNQVGYVHDMQSVKLRWLRKDLVRMIYHWLYFTLYLRMVSHILCVSDASSDDVKKFSGRKATTVYNSINNVFEEMDTKPIECLENVKYILDVNSFMDYKNPERLIKAFAMINDTIPHLLYLKGYGCDDKRLQELKKLVESLKVQERVILDINNRTPEEMAYLYDHADLFISPSLMEGFGLTPIEAVIHGCPTIVSNIKTLVEVTDHRVNTFNPYSVKSIASAIVGAINNPPTKKSISELASYYKDKYSLEKQIQKYEQIFMNILG